MRMLPVMLVLACRPDTGFSDLQPRIAVAPAALDFGDVAVPTDSVQTVFITNSGLAELELVSQVSGDSFSILGGATTVLPSETLELEVTFAPASFLDYDAELVVTSNDALTPEVRVPLTGRGVSLPLPDIELDPQTFDFGDVVVGDSSTQFVLLRNVGDAPLTLGSLSQVGSGAFELQTDPSNNVVGADSEVPVLITYRPFADQGDSGVLSFPSDDPDEPSVDVVLLGNGGGDFDYPIADIDCPGTSEPPIWVDFDGTGSSDPAGYGPLTYAWTLLDKPSGSQEALVNPTSDVARLFTDVAGPYEVQLVVTNTIGTRSAPDRCTVDAIPVDELHIELIWDTPAADLDLHLARSGAGLFAAGDDCTFCNVNPNWGGAGADDDPRLDLDDQGGLGPENINVRVPSEDGYQIRVHYYEEHGDDVVNATVRVFTYGVLAWEGQRPMSENEVWDVGVVNWPAGTVGVLSTDNYVAPARSCLP